MQTRVDTVLVASVSVRRDALFLIDSEGPVFPVSSIHSDSHNLSFSSAGFLDL